MSDASCEPADPFEVMAEVKALRAMADLAGFPHHSSWDGMEAQARERLRRLPAESGNGPAGEPQPATPIGVDDPLLLLAQMKAVRLAADSMGLAHQPGWDETEASATSVLRREAHENRPAD